jgi:ABC-2 type transport system ATP-binding protein
MVKENTSPLVVEAIGLTKIFKDFWMRTKARAVDGVDLEIRAHEIFGLLGPNGSGKSTIIKMILGLLHKTKGRLSVFGRDPNDVAIKKRIGFLPEESYMYRFLDPRETLDYYGRLFHLERRVRQRRIDELLEMVGLDKVGHRTVGEFSKGMTRRLGLAQALINDPDFLILDEPTSGLDPIGTRQVKDLLLELGRRGKTILLSSHLLADVEDVCDRMVMLYGGKIRAQGTAAELLADTQRTIIQTARLRPETITKIERVLLEAEQKGIERVEAPRQRLEQLFLDIVERARREQVATSGAQHGGATASFLRADESTGEGLIDRLSREQAPAAPTMAAARPVPAAPGEDVLAKLMNDAPSPTNRLVDAASSTPAAPLRDVDDSLIRSLLLDEGKADGESKDRGRGSA